MKPQAEHAGSPSARGRGSAQHRGRASRRPHQRGQRRSEGCAPRHGRPDHADHSHRGRSDAGVPLRAGAWQRQQVGSEAAHQASAASARLLPRQPVGCAPRQKCTASLSPHSEVTGSKRSEADPDLGPATDFAFIEPSYRPKDSVARRCRSGGGRALERATLPQRKFAEQSGRQPAARAPALPCSRPAPAQPAVNMAAEQKVQSRSSRPRHRSQVHRRADLGQPEGCRSERLLPPDPRDQRTERRARSQRQGLSHHRAR